MNKVEHNGFPHGVFLIKILTILLLGELPFSAAYVVWMGTTYSNFQLEF